MLDLRRRGPDVRRFVNDLERWVIGTLAEFGIAGERRQGRVGVWVETAEGEKKIAELGIRLRRWVSFHGIAINLNPDLEHFGGIVPCGISDYGVTSFAELGVAASMADLDAALKRQFDEIFGR